MDVRENTARRNGDAAKELVELLVVAHGELDVAWDDAALLVVASGVASELEDLSAEVLEDRSEVHWGTSADAGGELAVLEVSADAADRELEPCLGGARDALGAGCLSAFCGCPFLFMQTMRDLSRLDQGRRGFGGRAQRTERQNSAAAQ